MPSMADEFRAEAIAKQGDVVARHIRGWSFCLSYGAVDPRAAAALAMQAGIRVTVKGIGDVTRTIMDRLRGATAQEMEEAKRACAEEWTLSARLEPPGRSSSPMDWKFLGMMLAALRVPPDAATKPIENTAPNATHYWVWRE
jgi:hypothetical protein